MNFRQISPSLFMNASQESKSIDDHCRNYLSNTYPYFSDDGFTTYDRRRFESCATISVPLMLASGLALQECTALEIGCGRGMKSFPMAPLFKQYIGVDLDADVIRKSEKVRNDLKIDNLHFYCANALDVAKNPKKFGAENIDVLFLNAVVEHLTLGERLEIFALMRNIKESGGSVIFLESPNRLFPFDHHSSELHFVDNLPDDLALRYIRKKTSRSYAMEFVRPHEPGILRSDDPLIHLQKDVLLYETDPLVRLYRLGRGISYHDFELDYYNEPAEFNPLADGYHPLLLNHQPLTRTEISLQNYFVNNGLSVHRLFSRSWIDFFDIAGKTGTPEKVKYVKPIGAGIFEVVKRNEFWSLDLYVCAADGQFTFNISEIRPFTQFILILEQVLEDDLFVLTFDGEVSMEITMEYLSSSRPKTWHKNFYLPISIPDNCQEMSISSKAGSKVFLHGALAS